MNSNSIFNVSSNTLIDIFNFISKVSAVGVGQCRLNPNDRIILAAKNNQTDILWKNLRKNMSKLYPELLAEGFEYTVCYRKVFEESNIDIYIYLTDIDIEKFTDKYKKRKNHALSDILNQKRSVRCGISEAITIDDIEKIIIALPDIRHLYNDKLYDVIYDIFDIIIDHIYQIVYKPNKVAIVNIANKLTCTFTLMTGLFPEDYCPEGDIEHKIKEVIDEMFKEDGDTIFVKPVLADGYMKLSKEDPSVLLQYIKYITTLGVDA